MLHGILNLRKPLWAVPAVLWPWAALAAAQQLPAIPDAATAAASSTTPAVVSLNDPTVVPFDPILSEALVVAIATHPSVRAAESNVRAAGADIRAAKWGRFPSVSVEGLLLSQSVNRMQAQLVVEEPIWAAGRIDSTIGRAQARKLAALAAFDEAGQSIAISVVRSYFEVQRGRQRLQILNSSLQRHQQMVQTMWRRVEQEVSPVSDLELARARTAQVDQQVAQATAQVGQALQQLRDLVGDPQFDPDQPTGVSGAWPVFDQQALVASASDNDPRQRRLRAEAEVAAAETRIARAQRLPQLTGQYSYSETLGHRFGLVLKAQTGGGGLSQFAAADAARQREEAAQFQIGAAARELVDQISADFHDYEAGRARAFSADVAATNSDRVTESYVRQFTSGRRTWLDVMNAIRESTSARLDALDARVSTDAALSRLMIRTGNWQLAPEGTRP